MPTHLRGKIEKKRQHGKSSVGRCVCSSRPTLSQIASYRPP